MQRVNVRDEKMTFNKLLTVIGAFLLLATMSSKAIAQNGDQKIVVFNGSKIQIDQKDTNEPIDVILNDKKVFHTEDALSASVAATISISGGSAFLVEIDSGGTACPATFRLIVAYDDAKRQPQVSEEFGSCSDFFGITAANVLTVTVPKFRSGKASTLTLSNGKITVSK